jgi:hypothetical protein
MDSLDGRGELAYCAIHIQELFVQAHADAWKIALGSFLHQLRNDKAQTSE